MTARGCLLSGIILMMLGVMIGAFGAHSIQDQLSARFLQTWQTATEYHFYHALGLIGLGIYYRETGLDPWTKLCGWLLLIGIVLFSGSLYLLVLSGHSWLGMITPLGGISFIAAWLSWAISVIKNASP
ncbi:MAG: DUF423 domain-containing protein [Gammaproteobacteria bacterium]|nr:DUF423 domain-containing protein [Gammaproteobacteria bacterium]